MMCVVCGVELPENLRYCSPRCVEVGDAKRCRLCGELFVCLCKELGLDG